MQAKIVKNIASSFRFQRSQSTSEEMCHKNFYSQNQQNCVAISKSKFCMRRRKKWKDTVSRCVVVGERERERKMEIPAESSRAEYKNAPHIFDGSSHYLISLAFDDSWGGFIEEEHVELIWWYAFTIWRHAEKSLLSFLSFTDARDINLWLSI